jgi:hypothetical protein
MTLVYPYYNNPGMLKQHYDLWSGFSTDTKTMFDVVIVDDGSRVAPAVNVPRPEGLPHLQLYRIIEDKDWNWCGARNLGAKEAPGQWLFLTDMDHMVPEDTIRAMYKTLKPNRAYRPFRLTYPGPEVMLDKHGHPKRHPNTWVMEKEMYWKIGGYDEFYSGQYGFDGVFHSRVEAHAQVVEHPAYIIRVPREVVPDASTDNKARKAARPEGFHKMMRAKKDASPSKGKILTFQFTWERQI